MYDYNYGYSYGYNEPTMSSGAVGGFLALMRVFYLIAIACSIFMIVCQYKIYKKAGKKGWEAIVPVYNIIVLLQIVELPLWYIALFFVPFANIYAMFKIFIELAHKFGKSTGFGVLTVFFSIVTLPILAFDKKAVYMGGSSEAANNNGVMPTNTNQTAQLEQPVVSFDANPIPQEPIINQTVTPSMNPVGMGVPIMNEQANVMEQSIPVSPMPMQETEQIINISPSGPGPVGTLIEGFENPKPVEPAMQPQAPTFITEAQPQPAPGPIGVESPLPFNNPEPPQQPVVAPMPAPTSQPDKFCPNCGTRVSAEVVACPNCGTNL